MSRILAAMATLLVGRLRNEASRENDATPADRVTVERLTMELREASRNAKTSQYAWETADKVARDACAERDAARASAEEWKRSWSSQGRQMEDIRKQMRDLERRVPSIADMHAPAERDTAIARAEAAEASHVDLCKVLEDRDGQLKWCRSEVERVNEERRTLASELEAMRLDAEAWRRQIARASEAASWAAPVDSVAAPPVAKCGCAACGAEVTDHEATTLLDGKLYKLCFDCYEIRSSNAVDKIIRAHNAVSAPITHTVKADGVPVLDITITKKGST